MQRFMIIPSNISHLIIFVLGALSVDPGEGVSSETVFGAVASEFASDSEVTYDFSTVNKQGRRTPLREFFLEHFPFLVLPYFNIQENDPQ